MKPWEETWEVSVLGTQVVVRKPEPTTRVPAFIDWNDIGAPREERAKAAPRACLTAAAPDMYLALEAYDEMLKAIRDPDANGSSAPFVRAEMKFLRLRAAALRKARGER